jgi:hypothetical protein
MPLQGEAKTRYQRDYMRRRRADLRVASAPTKPAYESRLIACSFCGEVASEATPLVEGNGHVRICAGCAAAVMELIARDA